MAILISTLLLLLATFLYRRRFPCLTRLHEHMDLLLQMNSSPEMTTFYSSRRSSTGEDINDYLISENELLHCQISYLKEQIENQRNDIMRLQQSLTSVVRRLTSLEKSSSFLGNKPSRSQSQSFSPIGINTLTRSEYTPSATKDMNKRASQTIMNIPMGKSSRGSPMRKWMSNMDMISNQTNLSAEHSEENRTAMITTVNFTEPLNIPSYELNETSLKLFISGRKVVIPLPTGVVIEPQAEVLAPKKMPSLEWSFGFRGENTNIKPVYLPTAEIVYATGNVIILFNTKEKKQRFFLEHTNQIKCLALHPNKHVVASGQDKRDAEHFSYKSDAEIIVWDSISLSKLYILKGEDHFINSEIVSISFSQYDGGSHILVIDSSKSNNIFIINTLKKKGVAKKINALQSGNIITTEWHPVTAGIFVIQAGAQLTFWNFDGKTIISLKHTVTFEGTDRNKSISCFCFTDAGQLATGDSSGTIALWNTDTFKITKQAHSVHPGGVLAISVSRKGYLLTAGKDKTVNEWDMTDLVRRKRPADMPDEGGLPSSILSLENDQFIIGTVKNTLYEGSFDKDVFPLIQGDKADISSCEALIMSKSFLTSSKDGGLRLWSLDTYLTEWYRKFSDGINCITAHEPSNAIVVAFSSGTWCLLDLSTKEQIFENSESPHPVTCLKFSPNGHFLFIAKKNLQAFIYRLDNSKKLHKLTRFSSLSAPIQSMDWDVHSQNIRANSYIGHSYFWALSGESLDLSIARDIEWSSSSCNISFECGCLQHTFNGAGNVSSKDDIIYCGNQTGSVRLYRKPVTSFIAGYHELIAHSHSVSVTPIDDKHFITYGDKESSLLLWKLE